MYVIVYICACMYVYMGVCVYGPRAGVGVGYVCMVCFECICSRSDYLYLVESVADQV